MNFLTVVIVAVVAVVLIAMEASALPVGGSGQAEDDCRPPDNVAELFRRLNSHLNTSQLLQPTQLADPSRLLPSELNSGDVVLGLLYGGSDCPKDVETSPQAPLMARSSCPWYLEVEQLPANRFFPALLPQARCRCRKCLRQSDLGCEPVLTQVRLLEYTGCRLGFKTYREVTRPVSVGCTCAAAPMVEVGGLPSATPSSLDYQS